MFQSAQKRKPWPTGFKEETQPVNSTEEKKWEVLAIIPARGGSKRIPRKNIIDLCGKPLIAYSIEAALKTRQVTRVIVSTEDREIAEISCKYGAEVPFLRPNELATDSAILGEAVNYTLLRLKECGYRPDLVVELYPTHIFRTPGQISFLIEKLKQGHISAKTVKPVTVRPGAIFPRKETAFSVPSSPSYIVTSGFKRVLFKAYGLIVGRNLMQPQPHAVYLSKVTDPIRLIDIDNYHDLCMAEAVIRNNLFVFDADETNCSYFPQK